MANQIDSSRSLAFQVKAGNQSPLQRDLSGQDLYYVEARQMYLHQKEAITQEGVGGSIWRLPSDEGLHLHGTDLAPFPLGFFNAGLQGDLIHTLVTLALQQAIDLHEIRVELSNHYWLTGSFVMGTGQGHVEPTKIQVDSVSSARAEQIQQLVQQAMMASPAMNYLRSAMHQNTFAIYINGRRRPVAGVQECQGPDAIDPFIAHTNAPEAMTSELNQLIQKLMIKEDGQIKAASATVDGRLIRNVLGHGVWRAGQDYAQMETWLEMPGTTHFAYRSAVGSKGNAPSALALLSSGIAFCYMTQLSRYIENMKMDIHGIRLVQMSPYEISQGCGHSMPIQTHLFLNGDAPEATHTQLLEIAAHTCYLHVTAATAHEPILDVVINPKNELS